IAAALVAVVLAIIIWRLRPLKRWPADMPYRRRNGLLSRGELAFHRALAAAIPKGTALCPKVRLADVVTVPPDAWYEDGRQLGGNTLDSVLVDAETMAILLGVELDDRSHERGDRRERDAFVDSVLASAGVPIVRVVTTTLIAAFSAGVKMGFDAKKAAA